MLDYLSQLLGSKTPVIQNFVENVASFKRGEVIQSIVTPKSTPPPEPCDNPVIESKPPALRQSLDKVARASLPSDAQRTPPPVQARNVSPKKSPKAKGNESSFVDKKPSSNSPPKILAACVSSQGVPSAKGPPDAESTADAKPAVPKKTGPPPRGKAPFDCGCYGCLHKPLTNCLYCGRVACEKEGYNFCPFCGYLVEKVRRPEGDVDAAWLHKEQLLQYDRDLISRSMIIDDQADYYSKDSVWHSAEEREAAELQEAARQEELLRKRLHLHLSL